MLKFYQLPNITLNQYGNNINSNSLNPVYSPRNFIVIKGEDKNVHEPYMGTLIKHFNLQSRARQNFAAFY